MKKILLSLMALLLLPTLALAAPLTVPSGGTGWGVPGGITAGDVIFGNGLNPLATSSALTFSSSTGKLSFTYGSTTALSATTLCLTGDTCRTTWPTGGGSTFAWPFTAQSYGVSTSTTVGFLNGLFSTASSTFSGPFRLPALSDGGLAVYSGLVTSGATTTAGTGLSYTGNSFNVNTTQNILKISGLTPNGFVKTSGGDGTLSVDTAAYLNGLGSGFATTTSSAVTFSTTTLSFNGLTLGMTIVPSSGALTFTPTVTGTLSNSGLANSTISGVALGGTLNALTATNGSLTFSGSYDGTTARTVGLNLGNANTWTVNQTFNYSSSTAYSSFVTASTTNLIVNGSSFNNLLGTGLSLSSGALTVAAVPNSALSNSTISGVSLGGTLAALTATDASLTFSGSYTGTTARTVGLNVGNTNTWSIIQNFGAASTTQLTASSFLAIPTSSSQSPTVAGQVAHDTTSDQIKYGNGTATKVLGNGNQYASFTYATSTAWTATTTIPLGTSRVAETWNDIQCFTDVGTLFVDIYHTTTHPATGINASTTANINAFSSNNTTTAGEKRYVDVGTPASSPTKISCTLSKSITAD